MDAKLFDAFNAHNLDAMMAMFADDLEFYQDNDGVSNYQQSKNDFTKMLASIPDIRRELVKNSSRDLSDQRLRSDRDRHSPLLPQGGRQRGMRIIQVRACLAQNRRLVENFTHHQLRSLAAPQRSLTSALAVSSGVASSARLHPIADYLQPSAPKTQRTASAIATIPKKARIFDGLCFSVTKRKVHFAERVCTPRNLRLTQPPLQYWPTFSRPQF